MSNILVTGSNGQLGSEFRYLDTDDIFYFTDKSSLDITDFNKIKEFCKKNSITHIINCASYTAVDKAEEEKELAKRINFEAVKNLALISKELDVFLIHLSTDYVFDGKSNTPYREDDKTNPINFYGYTKLLGEEAIKEVNPKALIVRTSWVYGKYGNNFVKKILKLAQERDELNVIFDQIGTPTFAKDLAKTILKIIQHSTFNIQYSAVIYHYSNEGVCSWYDFAKEIVKLKKIKCKIYPIHTIEYPTLAKRPHISLLDKSKIKEEVDIVIPYWKDSLEKFLKEIN
jgi:dTDP-4-dehydrorhamnose reductase